VKYSDISGFVKGDAENNCPALITDRLTVPILRNLYEKFNALLFKQVVEPTAAEKLPQVSGVISVLINKSISPSTSSCLM